MIWLNKQYLNALVPIGQGVHGTFLLRVKLCQHRVGLIQGHLEIEPLKRKSCLKEARKTGGGGVEEEEEEEEEKEDVEW